MGWRGPLTHRQYRVWQAWQEQQWNRPSRADHYSMAITCELRRAMYLKVGMDPNEVTPQQCRLEFGHAPAPVAMPTPTPTPASASEGVMPLREQEDILCREMWIGRLGGKSGIRIKGVDC